VRLWICIASLAVVAPLRAQEGRAPLEVRRLAELGNALRESSGVAVSRAHPGIFWTHNDSGDGPYVYATDTTGTVRARFAVTGARNVDWEAITLGDCTVGAWRGQSCLFIGDTGDNDERRSRVVLYTIPEPDPDSAGGKTPVRTPAARALRLRYRDRPRDAEALVATPDGALSLITKGRTGPILRFTIPAEAWRAAEYVLANPDTLPITPQFLAGRWVTDAAIDPAGRRAAVRTYTEIYFFSLGARWTPVGEVCRIGLIEPQGEAIGFLDEQRLLLTSERAHGAPAVLTVVRCP